MTRNQKGVVFLPIIIVVTLLLIVGYFTYQNLDLKQQNKEVRENSDLLDSEVVTPYPTKAELVVTPYPTETEKTEIAWVDHLNSEKGISFKHPKDWKIVYALGDDWMEIDINSSEKDAFVFIAVYLDESIGNELNIKDAISEKESDIKSNENYKVSSFKSSVQGNIGNYIALGEQQYFVFADEAELGELDVATYIFQERGLYKVGEKTVVLHGMTLPGSQNENTITQIIESFELK